MMQSELLQPMWSLHNMPASYSTFDPTGTYGLPIPMEASIGNAGYSDYSSSFSTPESSTISMDTIFANMNQDSLVDLPRFGDDMDIMESFSQGCKRMDESDSEGNLSSELSCDGAELWSPPEQNRSSTDSPLINMNMKMETDSRLVLHHLIRAYGEAMENDQKELMEVIVKRVNEKIDPLRDPVERLAFYLFQSAEDQSGYLKQESAKNFEAAFRAFYQLFPYGRLAHFAANSAILEAIPRDVETIHIVDFDMGDGIQWPPMIEAIRQKGKALRLTSIKPDGGHSSGGWKFDETKQRLYDHARFIGLSLRVDEMTLGELTTESKRMKKRFGGREWMAFNCMTGLPHMFRRQERSDADRFVRVARELLAYAETNHAGILTYGDGATGGDIETRAGYSSFFNAQVMRYQALLESMEGSNFPVYLIEARLAMESLFVGPNICSLSWLQQWKESREGEMVRGLEGRRISKESLIEARELVNEKASPYKVKIQGIKGNQMVLEWKDTPLLRVCSWML